VNLRKLLTPGRIALAVLVLALASLAVHGRFEAADLPNVTSSPVTRGDFEMDVLATGTIEAAKLVSVGAQTTGELKRLYVALGDHVKKGDLIAEFDSMQQQNDLRRATAALLSAKADRDSKAAALKQDELALARLRALLTTDAAAHSDVEAAEANLDMARAAVAGADSAVAQAVVGEDIANVNLGYCRVLAPMDGTVVAVVTEQGQTVNAAQSSPTIIKLARLDTMTVKAQISEADVPRVKAGMPVYFTLLGDPDTRYETVLRSVEPGPTTLASDTGAGFSRSGGAVSAIYYNGIFDVPNPQGKLRIAMTAQATIVLEKLHDVLLIPSAALGERDKHGRISVRVLAPASADGNVVRPQDRLVTIGLNNRVQAQVLDGLKVGERVVTSEAPSANAAGSGADGQRDSSH
jgi:macrolide-specific efflux system membrane fusion protein